MSNTTTAVRGYRYGERRRSGLFGTVPPVLAGVGIVALVAGWLAVSGYIPIPLGILVALASAWLWFGKLHDRPAHEILPALVRWSWRRLRSRNTWYRPVVLVSDGDRPVALPPVMSGLDLFEFEVPWITPGADVPIGVVRDLQAGSMTAVMRVSGDGQFALDDASDQDMRIDEWGAAIGGFSRENSPVSRVTFHDWTSPVPIRDTVAQLEARWAEEPEHPARPGYLQLLSDTSAYNINHEVLVEVTVDLGRLKKTKGESIVATGLKTVAEQTRLFAGRIQAASGLRVEALLSASDLVTATRVRADPSVVEQLATLKRSLASATGVAAPTFGPMYLDEQLSSVTVDGAFHRSWWFASWPRREVSASWMDSLMFESGCTRSLTTVFEPLPPSKSDSDVDRERTQREANIESRRRKGNIIRRADHKAVEEVEAREHELSAGFVECRYTGLVTLTARSPEDLAVQAADLEQAAANSGVELQPLMGRQAEGWVSSLPLGRTVARQFGAL